MAAKPQTPPKKAPRERAVDAALALAEARDWASVTLAAIAKKADLSLAALHEIFEDKSDILAAYGRMLDRKVLENMGEGAEGADSRELLFDIMMERFDLLNDNRAAMVSILNSFWADPKEVVISFPHLGRSMVWMAEAANIETGGIKGAIKIAGLTGVYLAALRVWKDDDSRDLSKTMAALDRYLDRAQQVMQTVGL
jgi:AcrR family transcriptional regulator